MDKRTDKQMNGIMIEWKNDRTEERKKGKMNEWKDKRKEERKKGRMKEEKMKEGSNERGKMKEWKNGREEERKKERREEGKKGRMIEWNNYQIEVTVIPLCFICSKSICRDGFQLVKNKMLRYQLTCS